MTNTIKHPWILIVVALISAMPLLTGCANQTDDTVAEYREYRAVNQMALVRISFSGKSGVNFSNEYNQLLNRPTEKHAREWADTVSSAAQRYSSTFNHIDSMEHISGDPDSQGRLRREFYWSSLQDGLLRLKAFGHTANVEFLNQRGEVIKSIHSDACSPELLLQSASTPAVWLQKSYDIGEQYR